MRFSLNVSCDITTDVGSRSSPQPAQVAPEIPKPGRGPPETKCVRIVTEAFARIQVVSFQQGFRALKLVVCEIVFVVEMGDFVVDSLNGRMRLIWCCLSDNGDRPNVALSVIPDAHCCHQTGVDEIPLETRIGLSQDK